MFELSVDDLISAYARGATEGHREALRSVERLVGAAAIRVIGRPASRRVRRPARRPPAPSTLEGAVYLELARGPRRVRELAQACSLTAAQVRGALQRLRKKRFVTVNATTWKRT